MPRRRHAYRNYRFAKANNVWLPDTWDVQIGKSGSAGDTTLDAGQVYKLTDLRLPDTDFETTFERIRGQIQTLMFGSQGANAVIFGYVHKDKAVAGNADGHLMDPDNVADPFMSTRDQDTPIMIDACAPVSSSSRLATGPNVAVDVKSKRKVEKDNYLTLFCKIISIFQTANANDYMRLIGAIRTLWRFKL